MTPTALEKISDPELRLEVRNLFRELQLLAEAPAQNLEPSGPVSHGKASGSAPKGANPSRSSDDPMSKDVSLYEHWAFRIGMAANNDNQPELQRLLILARRDLEDYKHRPDEDRVKIQQERLESRDIELLLAHGEGIHAGVLAARHRWPIGWVRHVRERNGKEPDYGWERPDWKSMSEDERYAFIEKLQGEGLSQRECAERIGVSKTSISRFWLRAA